MLTVIDLCSHLSEALFDNCLLCLDASKGEVLTGVDRGAIHQVRRATET